MGADVEFAAEEEDPGAIVGEAAETTGIGLEGLDLRVEAFGEGVGDGMLEVGEQMNQVGFEGAGDGHDLRRAAPHDGAVPLLEEARSTGGIRLAPKLDPLFVVQPGAGRLQVHLQQFAKAGLMPVWDRALQPEVPGLSQRLVASGREAGRLLPAGPVYRLIEMLGDVEAIVDDRRLGSRLTGGRDKVGAHIHRRSLDQSTLFWRQRSPERHRLGGIASLHHLQQPGLLQVGHQRHVPLAKEETLLVQPARRCSLDQSLHAVPVQPQQLGGLRQRAAGRDHRHREGFELHREAALRLRPRHPHRLNPMFRTLAPRHRAPQLQGVLHHAEVAPGPLG